MAPEDLLQMAADLVDADVRKPRRTYLCRALSAVYYALFHCLARTCADSLAGGGGKVGNRPMWRRVYRALEHGETKKRCENVPSSFPEEIREFGVTFSAQQRKRHFADYDPDYQVGKSDVVADIIDVRTAISRFLEVPANVRRDFAIHVLMKVRADV